MPRLVTESPPQHGTRTGTSGKRGPAEPLPRSKKAPRKRVAEDRHRKKPVYPSPSSQAAIATQYKQNKCLKPKPRKKAQRALAAAYGVSQRYPKDIASKLIKKQRMPTRKGIGRSPTIGPEEELLIIETLKAHGFTMRFTDLEEETGIPKSTIQRFMAKHKWRQVKKGIRPHLTEDNIKARLEWAEELKDDEFDVQVDIDEKWFYVWSDRITAKLPPGQERPKSKMKSKRNIPKIMVLTAIARPRPEHHFNGLVGIWRVCDRREAKRGDKRTGLKKGDIITEDKNMDGPRFVKMVREKVIPAIRQEMSWATKIKLQFDNAPGHLTKGKKNKETGEIIYESTIAGKLNDLLTKAGEIPIELVRQIANSPDTNLNDLGFYNSLDSQLPQRREFKLDEFEKQVEAAFWAYPEEKLERIVRAKIGIIKAIIADKGDNTYKIPHSKIE